MNVIKKTYLIAAFILYYLYKLIQSNLYLAYDILTPRLHTSEGLKWIDLKTKSDVGLLLFSNLLSMTPGTLSVDISSDRTQILVHYLYNEEEEKVLKDIDRIQDKIINLTN